MKNLGEVGISETKPNIRNNLSWENSRRRFINMSRKHWTAIAAAGLALTATASGQENDNQLPSRGGQVEQEGRERTGHRDVQVEIASADLDARNISAFEKAPEPEGEHRDPCENERSDLCQQWRMAEATERLLALTRLEIAALVVTLALSLFATLASILAVRVQIGQGRRGLRAYLGPQLVCLERTDGEPWYLRVTIKNTGSTVAFDFRCRIIADVGDLAEIERRDLSLGQGSVVPVFPGDPFATHGQAFDADMLAKLREASGLYVVRGAYEYRDAFGDDWEGGFVRVLRQTSVLQSSARKIPLDASANGNFLRRKGKR